MNGNRYDWFVRIIIVPMLGGMLYMWTNITDYASHRAEHEAQHAATAIWMGRGDRFTQSDGYALERRIEARMEARYPNNDQFAFLVEKLSNLQKDMNQVKEALDVRK